MGRLAMNRRTFLKAAGATSGVAALMAMNGKGVDLFQEAAYAGEKVEEKVGYCGICGMECAYVGKVVNGKLVKLEGNPKDLQSGGSLCAKGNSGVSMLYDPDRLKYPLLRTNPEKGVGVDPKWKRISWEEAFAIGTEKLNAARQSHGGKSILWIGKHKGNDFLNGVGSPNDICHHSTCDTVRDVACEVTLGSVQFIPDLAESNYILCFGWDQFGKAKNAWARALADNLGQGKGKLVVVDPRMSPTATKAHEWIPVRPGGDHAMTMAMLHVIIKENLYDAEYVAKYTVGFEKLWPAVEKCTPDWASKLSGVSAETIARIAREFAQAPSAVIPFHKREAAQVRENGMSLARAMLILMIITGNFEKRGGALLPRSFKLDKMKPKAKGQMETLERVDGAEKFPLLVPEPLTGHGLFQAIPDAILTGKPYPVKAAIIYAQGLFAMSDPAKYIEALKKLDFVININIYPDEIATLADLVLPEVTYMEKTGLSARKFQAIYSQIAVSEALVEPMYECLSLSKILSGIMKPMGLADYLTPGGKDTFDAQLAPAGITYKEIIKMGGVYTPSKTFKPKDLTDLKTPSKKLEIFSEEFEKHGYENLPVHRDNWMIAPTSDNEFYFTTTRMATHRHASTQNVPWLYEIDPENYVQINTQAAGKLGIKNGDLVEVTGPAGKVKIKAKLTAGIRPDTICIPHGYGHWSKFITLTFNKGANDGEIMPAPNVDYSLKLNDPSGSSFDCQFIAQVQKA